MKNKIVIATLVAVFTGFAVNSVQALTEKEIAAINKIIKEVPTADIAVKSAEIVSQAAKKERIPTAVAVVRAAIIKNSGSTVSIVSSVIKAAPITASAVAAIAVKLVPDQIEEIAAAAALAAPDLADKIVLAIADIDPKYEDRAAKAIMLAVPQAQAKIRQLKTGSPEANIGESYTSSSAPLSGSFPSTPPVAAYATPSN